MRGFGALLALMVVVASPRVWAQTDRPMASLTIEGSSVDITSIRPLTFAVPAPTSAGPAPVAGSPAIFEISGDPGRAYRIRLPDTVVAGDPNIIVDHLTIFSQTSGDVSKTLIGRINADGHDRLYIGGLLRRTTKLVVAPVTTTVPISLDYE